MRGVPLLAAAVVVVAGAVPVDAALRTPTLATHSGPWYREDAPEVSALWRPGIAGERLQLSGAVLDVHGLPVAGARLNLWHADAAGRYEGTPFRAIVRSRGDGRFALSTVMPGHRNAYRARHIHFVITHPGYRELVTRIYFKGDVNIAAAIYPELAVAVEQGAIGEEPVLFADVEFVLQPH